ncbi:MAG: hypothetical protein O3B95_03590 [Chloroflexi bacterium]|nr:hypothetical protein [Chloroflexota bacterium]
MAVESSSSSRPTTRVPDGTTENSSTRAGSRSGKLLPGERIVSELSSTDTGRFQLTHARVIFTGGAEDTAIYFSSQLQDITSVVISRRPRARRSAGWGVVGLFAAIGVWQVTPSSTIGLTASAIVAVISLVLMADYWIRPAGVHIELHTTGGKIGGEVGGSASSALDFAREIEDARRRLVPGRVNTPFRNYPSS